MVSLSYRTSVAHHDQFSACTWLGGATTSAHAKNNKGPKPREHVCLFCMKRDHNKGFYSHKCYLEASIALCFECAE